MPPVLTSFFWAQGPRTATLLQEQEAEAIFFDLRCDAQIPDDPETSPRKPRQTSQARPSKQQAMLAKRQFCAGVTARTYNNRQFWQSAAAQYAKKPGPQGPMPLPPMPGMKGRVFGISILQPFYGPTWRVWLWHGAPTPAVVKQIWSARKP